MAAPITPEQVATSDYLPDAVYEVFNTLISTRWDGTQAVVPQEDAVQRIITRLHCDRAAVFDNGYLDVESAYRRAGWDVVYDKPGFNETYPATFTFRKKRS